MPKLQLRDILSELIDLYREVIGEIRLQLNYYRVSVYKHETAGIIKDKINQLHFIAKMVAIDSLVEPFADYDASLSDGNCYTAPGECLFSTRVSAFMQALEAELRDVESRINTINAAPEVQDAIAKKCQKHRHQILSMCQEGTHHRTFFERM